MKSYMNPMQITEGNEWITRKLNKIDSRTPEVFAAGKIGANEAMLCSREEVPTMIRRSCAALAGIYPMNSQGEFRRQFCEAVGKMDLLCPWNIQNGRGEELILDQYASDTCEYADLKTLDPTEVAPGNPRWSHALEGYRVLVISPFKSTIEYQYENQSWNDQNILPELSSLTVVQSQYSLDVSSSGFTQWKDHMSGILDKIDPDDYDVALIGCGGISLILAAHLKEMGLSSIHTGGSTQLLFGIIGGRWENCERHSSVINQHWVRPFVEDQPDFPEIMERYDGAACYF